MTRNFRWIIIALLFIILTVNYIDRSAISFAIEPIQEEFGFSTVQMGYILGAFGIGYILSPFAGGFLSDKYGPKVSLTGSMILWTIAIGSTGFAVGFISIYLARFCLGLSEGPSFPASVRTVSLWTTENERATAISGTFLAVPFSMAIGSPLNALLVEYLGWRAQFLVLMALSALWIPLWLYYFTDNPKNSKFMKEDELKLVEQENTQPAGVPSMNFRDGWQYVSRIPSYWANVFALATLGYYLFFFIAWLPEFFLSTYQVSLAHAGFLTSLPWLVSVFVIWYYSKWSDYLLRKTKSYRISRSYLMIGSQLMTGIFIVPLLFAQNIFTVTLLLVFAISAFLSAVSLYCSVYVDLARAHTGFAMGISTTALAISSFLAPVITGYVVAGTGSFQAAFALVLGLAITSVIVLALFHHPDRDLARFK
ncbi:MFS transporter [Flexibacterium corallicola]|uniref:MFS transporter n=1 Tax=Flexibacterium corallicola TaxID=3037259 RepID=UPI00286F7A5A|nr:MFS transporter [Pseudovibrio sp. M1P-2-3]